MHMGLEDGIYLAELAGEQQAGCGQPIEHQAVGEEPEHLAALLVLNEEYEVVAEVVIELLRAAVADNAAAYVVYGAAGYVAYLVAQVLEAPAEVYLLHVGVEVGIEAAHLVVKVGTDHEAATGGPEYFYIIVVLAIVFLYVEEDAAAAEHVAILVHKATAGACILKAFAVAPVAYLGLAGGEGFIGFHSGMQWCKPAIGDLEVGTEQYVVFGFDLLECLVVAIGKAMVDGYLQGFYRREVSLHILQGIVGAGIIGKDDLIAGMCLLHYFGQKKLMPFSAIVAEYNNGSILLAYDHSGRTTGLFILRIVKCIVRHSDVVVLLVLVLVQVVATGPCKDEEAEEAQQEQKARF